MIINRGFDNNNFSIYHIRSFGCPSCVHDKFSKRKKKHTKESNVHVTYRIQGD